ncbi:MAG: hypothetical protein CMP22_04600 [Rickettsiales bacterium]|nr:hypothetical protein [Rickettsiales bacterium]|tara:strand:+ start:1391 stop:1729 length:339 start_codon:yes stop_codon:yes gene_type:complete
MRKLALRSLFIAMVCFITVLPFSNNQVNAHRYDPLNDMLIYNSPYYKAKYVDETQFKNRPQISVTSNGVIRVKHLKSFELLGLAKDKLVKNEITYKSAKRSVRKRGNKIYIY